MEKVHILDPSVVYRPDLSDEEKKKLGLHLEETTFKPINQKEESFRIFSEENELVKKTYKLMHTNQTFDFVEKKHAKYRQFNKAEMTIMEALEFMNTLIDESDPDVDVPNIYHAFQTAERIREQHPDQDWFHLVGLIHDLGKVMAIWGDPQWCVVGDTFPVGCAFDPSIVYSPESFSDNPDINDPRYNTKLGIYEENCGLDNIFMSWGHDEYMYHVLLHNNCKIPDEGLNMIRFHSFYPWHTCGAYEYLCSNKDKEMMKWVREFNQFDLYSKVDKLPDIDKLRPYYQSLIDKYCPGKLQW
ncbi:inositol oxygenase-like isoform X1 [Apostichopus japonicus]|uniref:inositol oxygenase-like isoform X1 n=1 Tax=Stichopus japonicus TaxID=307972 RepID=UPI003AB2F262